MTLSYSLRLIYFSLACFFAVNFLVSIIVRRFSARAIARAERMNSSAAARFLLALRLSPAALGLLCVALFCVPSYLWLEPDIAAEQASAFGSIAAICGFALSAFAIARATRSLYHSAKFMRKCDRLGKECDGIIGVPNAGRLIALVGIFRPRLVVSSDVIAALDPNQLAVALRHERVHEAARDNLKRLLILLAPAFFLNHLERAWKRFAEWAADDVAAGGDADRAADLASVLVRVARIKTSTAPPELATSLLEEDNDLTVRVKRLLTPPSAVAFERRSPLLPIAGLTAAFALLTLEGPSALAFVHRILERLMN